MYKVGRCLLRYRLQEAHVSQQELADKLDMKKSQVSAYINNRREMTLTTAKNISDVVNCHIEDLYEWDSR